MPDAGPCGRSALGRQPRSKYATALAGIAGAATMAALALPLPAFGAGPASPHPAPSGGTGDPAAGPAKPDPADPGAANREPANSDPANSDPANSDPANSDPANQDRARAGQAEPGSAAGSAKLRPGSPGTSPTTKPQHDSDSSRPGRPNPTSVGRDSGHRTNGDHGRAAKHPAPKSAGTHRAVGAGSTTGPAHARQRESGAIGKAGAGSPTSNLTSGASGQRPAPDPRVTRQPVPRPSEEGGEVDLAAAASGSTAELGLRLFVAGFIALLCSVFGLSAIALRRAWQPQR